METASRTSSLALALVLGLGLFTNAFSQGYQRDSLSQYIRIAIERNPGLKAQNLAHGALLEQLPQAGAFQDPELSLEVYAEPMDIVGGRSIGNLGVMQMFPWFGTRKAARREATHRANAQQWQYREAVDQLVLRLSTQWYALLKLKEQLHNTRENKSLLQQLEQLALGRFASPATGRGMSGAGDSGMSDVLRIQLELAEIENDMEGLQSQIEAEKAMFNALLDREAGEEVVLPETFHPLDFPYGEKEALVRIEEHSPLLEMISQQALALEAKVGKERKMSQPMIGIGLQYMIIGKTDNAMLAMGDMNGKDMIMPMVSMSLPLFRKKYDAQQREGELWWKSSLENHRDTFNALKSQYYTVKNQMDDARRLMELNEKQAQLAQTTYSLIVKEFVAGKSDLGNVIQVHRQWLDYRLGKAEALADYNTAVVSLMKLLADPDRETIQNTKQ